MRYLTGDVPELLGAATRILDETPRLRLTEVILTETAYVLTSFYEVPQEQVVDSLVDLIGKENYRHARSGQRRHHSGPAAMPSL